jgi:hypothetical protein
LADIAIGTSLYRYFELEIDRPPLPRVERWYRALQQRSAFREHVMIPFEELRGRLDYLALGLMVRSASSRVSNHGLHAAILRDAAKTPLLRMRKKVTWLQSQRTGAHFAVASPASLITFAHLTISLPMNARKCSGVSPTTVSP